MSRWKTCPVCFCGFEAVREKDVTCSKPCYLERRRRQKRQLWAENEGEQIALQRLAEMYASGALPPRVPGLPIPAMGEWDAIANAELRALGRADQCS